LLCKLSFNKQKKEVKRYVHKCKRTGKEETIVETTKMVVANENHMHPIPIVSSDVAITEASQAKIA
jgi:hypothetical protein